MPTKQLDIIVNNRAQTATRPDLIQAIAPYLALSWEINQELASPLAGIIGLTEQLLEYDDDRLTDQQRETLEQISGCAIRISSVLETLTLTKAAIVEDDYLRNRVRAVIERVTRFRADD
jgi:signal transduction histidine kinase